MAITTSRAVIVWLRPIPVAIDQKNPIALSERFALNVRTPQEEQARERPMF